MGTYIELIREFEKMTVLRHLIGFSLQILPVCFLIFYPFSGRLSRRDKRHFAYTLLAVLAFYLLVMYLCEMRFFPDNGDVHNPGITLMSIAFRICMLAIFIAYVKIVKADIYYKVAIFLLMVNYRLILTISINIYNKLAFVDVFPYAYPYRLDVVILYACSLLVTMPIMMVILKKVGESIFSIPTIVLRRAVFWLIPLLSLFFLFALYVYVVFVDNIDLTITLFIILFYVFISIMHFLIFMMVKETALRYENYLQYYALRTNYEKMVQHVDQVRKIKHETQSRLAYIRLCLENKEYDKLEEYLDNIGSIPVMTEAMIYTQDPFLNGILNYAMYGAEKIPLYLRAKIRSANYAPLSRMEITSILMNLLSNALRELKKLPEDCKPEDRDIHLVMIPMKDELLIACRNRLLHRITLSESLKGMGYGPLSESEHGHGLSIMRNIVESHGGRMNVTHDENFTVSLFIPQSSEDQAVGDELAETSNKVDN